MAEANPEPQAEENTRKLIVVGSIGEGKSTFMNQIMQAHSSEFKFVAKRSVKSVTT